MSILDIFGSSSKAIDTASNIAEQAASGIGRLFFTDNDKAKAAADYLPVWIDIQKTLATESSASAISRRILAWSITAVFLGMIIAAITLWRWFPEWSTFIFKEGVSRLEYGFGAVITTYFLKDAVVKAITANK